MSKTKQNLLFASALGLILSGCASADERYPSLAVRDAERIQGSLTPSPSQAQDPIAPPDLVTLEAALQRAEAAHSDFTSQQGNIERLVAAARGLGAEDDRRARALSGIAALISLHGQTHLALSDIDLLETKAASTFAQTEEIRAAQAMVLRMVASQDQTLESLSETLAR